MNHDWLAPLCRPFEELSEKLNFCTQITEEKMHVLTSNMAVLSRGWKPRMLCDLSASQGLTMPDVKYVYFEILLVYSKACDSCD